MTDSRYKIGIDFHGVITEAPVFFAIFAALALDKGYEIYVISGGPHLVVQNFLNAWHIGYNHIFSLIDHFASRGQVKYFSNGNFKVPDELWNTAKAEYCLKTTLISKLMTLPTTALRFPRRFVVHNPQTHTCEIGGRTIDFNTSPARSLEEIEHFLQQKIKVKNTPIFGGVLWICVSVTSCN